MSIKSFLDRLVKLSYSLQSRLLFKILINYRVLLSAEHRKLLRSGIETIIDIGANKGQFSLAARYWAPDCRIYAFEPLREAAEIYRRVFQDDHKVTFHQVAIGPENGESIIHISKADDSSSLLPISSLQSSLFPGTEEKSTEKVVVRRLSDLVSVEDLQPPVLLKLDVQGFELEVLKSCIDLLQNIDHILVECSFMELYKDQALAYEVVRYLDSNGFVFHNIYNLEYNKNGLAIQGDFVFILEGSGDGKIE